LTVGRNDSDNAALETLQKRSNNTKAYLTSEPNKNRGHQDPNPNMAESKQLTHHTNDP
jgi:hypothetical protein